MGQGFGHLQGAREVDYRGARFALGRTSDAYAIWDLAGGPPVRTFPLTDEAWPDAWLTYQAWEAGTPSPTTGEPPPLAQHAQQPAGAIMDYPGARHGLGRAEGRYFIWDLEARAAVDSFPETPEGWRDAWLRFQDLERPYAYVPPRLWEKGRPIPIRAMRAGQIVGGTFRLYFLHFWLLVALSAVIILPVFILTGAITVALLETVQVPTGVGTIETVEAPFWINLVSWVLGLVGGSLLISSLVMVIAQSTAGRRPTFGLALREGFRRLPAVLWVTFLLFLAILVLLIPAILAGVAVALNPTSVGLGVLYVLVLLASFAPIYFVLVRFLFAASIVVVEGHRGVAALRRSWELVRGLGWKVFGNLLLISLVAGGIIFGILLIGGLVLSVGLFSAASSSGSFDAGTATAFFIAFFSLYAVAFVLWIPFLTSGIVLQYFDARVRKEGFNEGVLSRELGQVPGAPTSP
jgi:hypothetical protein